VKTLRVVIAENARQLRQSVGATLDDVASAASRYGVNWFSAKIADIESGERAGCTVTTIVVLAAALSDVTGKDITVPDLLAGGGAVALGQGRVSAELGNLRNALSGRPVVLIPARERGWREAEQRAIIWLGLPREQGEALMMRLWGRLLHEECLHRAGEGANQQRLGVITRALRAELKAAKTLIERGVVS
jgi:hypothetical protein